MSKRLRLLALVLFGSVAVNLFLGGIMIGRWLEPHPPRHMMERTERPPREPGAPPSWLLRALGPEGEPALEAAWRRHAPAIEPRREDLRRAREAVIAALETEPFDRDAYAARLAAMQDSTARLFDAIHAAMVDVMVELTPEQRRMVVERSREWERRKSGRD